ncbi:PREDICTED: peptidyl-tRNA hydrolase ICT1, mitochondrial [Ceratosolen solmsi marchali]|uniref:Large ribosomal subunit protein mL62 n=1 Tax=Ceratosolen solmsi marchali TaxID=326594 RepID=A0AAJ6YSK8_9HYME|nr:PREDICTED: peptidyl-tRNA hydrolase ICT1, mitochondrial [Ceratosolen solmsi marchali]
MFAFKSAYCLEKLYPMSNLNLYTPTIASEHSIENFNGYIPLKEIDVTYSSSTGPGGQNVNRVNTKVDIRFKIKNASWISDEIKQKLFMKYQNNINKDGYLIIKSDLTRSQQLNLADALQKLRKMIQDLFIIPKQPTIYVQEKYRQRQIKAAQERVFIKRKRSDVKRNRQIIIKTD